jgi:predicted dehydrogenase
MEHEKVPGSGAGGSVMTVALVGAGQVAHHHAGAFSQLGPDIRIVGVADTDEARAASLAGACSARAFTDYRDLLELSPDIAVICIPHHLHREAGEAAAAAGSHVLMEKPLAHTLEDAYAILESCAQHGVRLTTSFVHRYRAAFQEAYRLIQDGEIGEPSLAVDRFHIPGGPSVPAWVWRRSSSGGGILMYSGIHAVDRLRWLFDSEVVEVYARSVTHSHRADVEDGLVATLIFDNGRVATLVENQPGYRVSAPQSEMEIFGSRASIRIQRGQSLEYNSDDRAYLSEFIHDDHFLAQARDVVAAVRERREPWISGQDGLRAQEIVMAIYRSAETGRVVEVQHRELTG